jgi:APA family basic amino acid/polyamine antiporter
MGSWTISAAQVLSLFVIVLLSYINTRGIKTGKTIQTVFTLTKLLSLFGLIAFGFMAFKADVWAANWQNPFALAPFGDGTAIKNYTMIAGLGAIAAAMVGSVFSSDSWNNVTFIASEVENPKRNIGLSLFLGTLIVTIIYILTNVAYIGVISLHDIAYADKDRVALSAAQVIFGTYGTVIIALMIMISTFGCDNGIILAGARVYYTMAKDALFFQKAGKLNNNDVPANALWMQCVVACAWSLSGKYGQLLDMISFVVVGFYILTIIGIFILRKKRPDLPRTYKAFGYPFLPILYILMGSAFCILLIIYKPSFTWPGLIITLLGVPVYYLLKARIKPEAS